MEHMNTTTAPAPIPACFTPQLGLYEITRDRRTVITADVIEMTPAKDHPDVILPRDGSCDNWLVIRYVPVGSTTGLVNVWTVAPSHLRYVGPVAS